MSDSKLPSPKELEILPADLHALLQEEGTHLRLIDCREEDEFAICRIEGGELVPLSRFVEEAPAKLLKDRETAMVVY